MLLQFVCTVYLCFCLTESCKEGTGRGRPYGLGRSCFTSSLAGVSLEPADSTEKKPLLTCTPLVKHMDTPSHTHTHTSPQRLFECYEMSVVEDERVQSAL